MGLCFSLPQSKLQRQTIPSSPPQQQPIPPSKSSSSNQEDLLKAPTTTTTTLEEAQHHHRRPKSPAPIPVCWQELSHLQSRRQALTTRSVEIAASKHDSLTARDQELIERTLERLRDEREYTEEELDRVLQMREFR